VLRIALVEKLSVVKMVVVDLLYLGFVEPFDALSVFPKAELQFIVFRDYVSA